VVADLAKLSAGREEYYVREVAKNREEYLSDHGESPGRWYGAGATALGQQGTAPTEASPPGTMTTVGSGCRADHSSPR
jgi:TrwC relaxase